MNSVLASLRLIFRPCSTTLDSNLRILDYRDEKTFRDLWLNGLETETPTIDGSKLDWQDPRQQILIIGNDPPDSVFDTLPACLRGINFKGHFTAASWLAAWKVKFAPSEEQRGEGKREPMASAAIVDPRTSSFSGGVSCALQVILGACDASAHTLVPRIAVLKAPRLSTICQWLNKSKSDKRVTPYHLAVQLKSTIWSALTSDREQHHALSNVLGALLLMAQVGPPDLLTQRFKLPVQEYLLALVHTCGVRAHLNQIETCGRSEDAPCWINESLHREIGGAVLLDDMSDLWTPFLAIALALYGSSFSQFISTPSEDFSATIRSLPQRLGTVLDRGLGARVTTSDLVPGNHASTDSFVLFLDLRLFTGQTPDPCEISFWRALAEFGIRLLDSGRNFPWLDTDHAKEELRAELDRGCQAKPLKNRETLLARLIALLDPTLPVVIFSSTRRSEFSDSFRGYGNLITCFRKPVLSGLNGGWAEAVAEIRADFLLAMEQAVQILKARRKLSRLATAPSLRRTQPTTARHIVEIFIDESGDPYKESDPGFAVGGILLRHDSDKARKEFHRVINQSAKKWGVSDHEADRIKAHEVEKKLPEIPYYPKKPISGGVDEREGFKLVTSALSEHSQIAAFALIDPDLLYFSRYKKMDSSILFERNALDNVYHTMLRANLEMLLFQHPWVNIDIDSIFIHVATRQQEMDDTPTRLTWHHAYGLEFRMRRGRWGFTSLGSDDVFRLVREILETRSQSNTRSDIVMARGVTLNDYEDVIRNYESGLSSRARVNSQLYDPSRVDPHQIHYIADWIVRIALYRAKPPSEITPWFEAGYVQLLNATFSALLDACRQKELDRAVQRLDEAQLTPIPELSNSWYAERYLRESASTWPSKLTGLQLRRLIAI